MSLLPLTVRPGIYRDSTLYSNKGGWYFCDKMRFRSGQPEKIGGWQKYLSQQLLGVARSILITADLTGTKNDGIGTNLKYYIVRSGSPIDVTPLRATTSLGSDALASTVGLPTVTVTDVASGAALNDFVTIGGATTFAGFTTGQLNDDHQITNIVDADNYQITLSTNASSTTTGGGGSMTAEYEIHVGLATQVSGSGWGAGVWGGTQGWGDAADVSVPGNQIRLWSQCTYGEDIIICPRGMEAYLWDATNPSARALPLSSLASASDTPIAVNEVLIADASRQVFAMGVNPIGSSVIDPMLIRFANFEDAGDWTPTPSNAAGELRLSAGSKIITSAQSHQEIVVFTDVALFSLQYINYPFYWGATLISTGQSIVGPNAKATVNQTIYWMGVENFYQYDGHTEILPCSINDFVFSDLDKAQTDKVFCGVNSGFGEIWWFYPSVDGAGECDSYVIFDYEENVWSYGTMDRTVWADAGIETYPTAVSGEGYFYNQEFGTDDGSANPPAAIDAYIQSSQFELDPAGDNFIFANRVIPDITFRPHQTTATTPTVNLTFYPQDYPGAPEKTGSFSPVAGNGVTVPIEQFTQQAWIRLRGRAMMIRAECNQVGVAFRLGTTRLDVRPDGKR